MRVHRDAHDIVQSHPVAVEIVLGNECQHLAVLFALLSS